MSSVPEIEDNFRVLLKIELGVKDKNRDGYIR